MTQLVLIAFYTRFSGFISSTYIPLTMYLTSLKNLSYYPTMQVCGAFWDGLLVLFTQSLRLQVSASELLLKLS